ncbi:MAG: DUF1467 family protein [Pseudomonadota bacterium]
MALTSMGVVFAVIWFMTLFVVLPLGAKSQGDAGKVAVGTPASAPSNPQMRRKFRITTFVALIITVPVILIINYQLITIDMIDLFKRFGPDS